MKKYDYIIVGSGLYGSVLAHRIHKKGLKCLVLEKRNHLGGNIYCENINGINVHKYGAHIFHTNNKIVWDFVNSFVEFNRYTNSPVANYKGKLFNLPFNMNTFYQIWGVKTPEEALKKLEEQRQEAKEALYRKGIAQPQNLKDQALLLIGKDIFETLIEGYTEKQWGRKCTELPAFIIKRLPVRFVFDNNYFNDKYQGIPIGGYNPLIEGLLRDIETQIDTNFFEERQYWESITEKIIYTGPIDEFFNFCYGKLEYRSLKFEEEIIKTSNFQGNAVINYTEKDIPYTRIIEHKHFEYFGEEVEKNPITVISKEYPLEWKTGMEAYYPINNEKNNIIAEKYRALALQNTKTIFGGRLAEYKYYDMAPIIEKALNVNI